MKSFKVFLLESTKTIMPRIGAQSPAGRARKHKKIDRYTKEPHGDKRTSERRASAGYPAGYDKKKAAIKKKLDDIKFKRELDSFDKDF